MEVKNTLLLVSVILVITLAAVLTGVFFYFSLEGDALMQAIANEQKEIGNRRVEKSEAEDDLKKIRDRIEVLDGGGLQKRAEDEWDLLNPLKDECERAQKTREDKRELVRPADRTLMDSWHRMEEQIKKAQNDINEEHKTFKSRYDAKIGQLQEVRKELLAEMGKKADPELLRMEEEAQGIEDEIRKLRVKIGRLREEARRRQTLEADGQIVHADEKTDTVTIDIGRAAGVRKGMLFDVFEIKRSGERVRKAKIQVTKIEAEYSSAIILAAQDPMPFCSNCGWRAYERYMNYCAYCSDGEDTNGDGIPDDAKKLSPGARELLIVSPDPLNPLVRGNFVSNPFYERGRRYVFALGGTTAFRSRDEIRRFVEAHGSELQDKITLSTDILIVGVGPEVDAAVQEARKLGVKVIREKELFTFFGGEAPE